MKLFISKELWRYRGYQIKTESLDKDRSKLIIPNFKENDKRYEDIEFVLPIKEGELKNTSKDLIINSSKLSVKSDGYTFQRQKKDNTTSRCVYALLHYGRVVPSDIYIPVAMKDNVEILKKIQFYDLEPDYGNYLADFYFVKISLSRMESIPFYLSTKRTGYLEHHLVFKKGFDGKIAVGEYTTCILLNSKNISQYISLSEL